MRTFLALGLAGAESLTLVTSYIRRKKDKFDTYAKQTEVFTCLTRALLGGGGV